MDAYFLWLNQVGQADINLVGGKNASLGEMLQQLENSGIQVPHGFTTTSRAFIEFLKLNELDEKIYSLLEALDVDDVGQLNQRGKQIRQWILQAPFPQAIEQALRQACRHLQNEYSDDISFAVRSSATAEDLPDASFAGQQESYLNIKGEDELLDAIRAVYASLFNDRAIAYRVHHGFAHQQVALSATVQKMVRSDEASSGVMFTLDTESGFRDVVFITSSYGLGEMIVQGEINPDEFYVHKPMLEKGKSAILRRSLGSKQKKMIFTGTHNYQHSTRVIDVDRQEQHQFSLSDDEVMELARLALIIEKHYQQAMDIEWAKDADDQRLYIVQARPETVKAHSQKNILQRYSLQKYGQIVTSGRSVGQRIGSGIARIIHNVNEMDQLQTGEILVTDMTDPDWEPVMKRASAIVTNRGGRTCHAAIIARELGVPAVVGCGDASDKIKDGDEITVSCAEGDSGYIYAGKLPFEIQETNLSAMPELPFKIMLNVASPERAFDFQFLPNDGVGLARLEFIINRNIGIHPRALPNYRKLPTDIQQAIDERSRGYADPTSFYIEKLVEGIATIAAAFWPKPVIVRLSDFKSNEYRNLIGGEAYEPVEENPMLGFRGASRYTDLEFQESFELECFAIKKIRDQMGLTNVAIMVPFVRTPEEAHNVINLLHDNDLRKGVNDLKIIMMCEIPANALLAERFLKYFDGFSIGSNDLTQLTLGLDRDSEKVAFLFDERNEAVKSLMSMAISSCRLKNKYIGICGQAPSDYPELAFWLMERGINSISLNPDSVIETWLYLAENLPAKIH
ncbi:Phosphoenolpyruvate synthase [hydrothermal vent metagenome]|uniref:Phosphoenolpyruvate synthase n=1 Tax=hydrothermal vent metagenome TaxID=652676 RepID=A0A3B1BLV2_9ZZZZ